VPHRPTQKRARVGVDLPAARHKDPSYGESDARIVQPSTTRAGSVGGAWCEIPHASQINTSLSGHGSCNTHGPVARIRCG
jgi:hypothetical protein